MSQAPAPPIATRQVDNYIGIVELQGEYVDEAAPLLDQAISAVIGHGYRWIIIDCQKLEFLDLTCAQALVANLARLQLSGGNLFLCGLSRGLWGLLKERYQLGVAVAENEAKARTHCLRGDGAYQPIANQKLWVWSQQAGPIRVIELLGSIYDEADVVRLDSAIGDANRVILECSRLVSLSIAGLGSLVGHFKRLEEQGGGLRVVKPQGAAAAFFTLAGPLFPPQESLEQAASSFEFTDPGAAEP